MDEENKIVGPDGTEPEIAKKSRREFAKTAAQVAVTAPAVAVLLSASAKSAFAQISPYSASHGHILDDFTFGNNREDIDNIGRLGHLSQDDHR